MALLQTRDLRDVVEINQRALACESMADPQQETLSMLERAIGANSSVYGHMTQARQRPRVIEGTEHGVPQGAMARWCARYHNQDPFMQRYLERLSTTTEHVVISADVISHREFVATRFYNEFLRPQSIYHVMILGLKPARGAPFGVIGLHRDRHDRPFSWREAAKANLLAPCLRGAVERIHARQTLAALQGAGLPPAQAALQRERLAHFGLTTREAEVVQLVNRGLTSQQIADELCISVRTVGNHLRSVYEKTGVHNRTTLLYRLRG